MSHNLKTDAEINKNDLVTECSEHAVMYWYWSDKAIEAKNKVKQLKTKLNNLMAKVRLEIIKKHNNTIIPKDDMEELLELGRDEAKGILELKRAEARAYDNCKNYPITSATGKEKDPTPKDIERIITLDTDFQDAEDNLLRISTKIKKIESKYHSTKDITAKDLDAMVIQNEEIEALNEELLQAQKDEVSYNTAVDVMDNRKKMLDNLTTLFVREYFAQPKPSHELGKIKPKFK